MFRTFSREEGLDELVSVKTLPDIHEFFQVIVEQHQRQCLISMRANFLQTAPQSPRLLTQLVTAYITQETV